MSWSVVFWLLLAGSLVCGVLIMLDRTPDLRRSARLFAAAMMMFVVAGALLAAGEVVRP